MRVWRYEGVHRLTWVVLALLVLAVAVFAMAAGFSRLRSGSVPGGTGAEAPGADTLQMPSDLAVTCLLGRPRVGTDGQGGDRPSV
jgi:hypothetical protein